MNNINLEIKVPVYITEWKEFNSMPLFSKSKNTEINYETINKSVKQKINDYNNRIIQEVKKRKKSKVKETYIEYIKSDDIKIDNKTSILLNITAFDTKNKDLSIENKFREFNLTEDDKLKKNNNYVLMYPQITGDLSFKYRWLFFLHEDPYKESIDFIHTVKLALKIFDLKLVNVKSKMLIEELKKAKNNYIPEIEVISKSENQTVNSEFRDFAEFHIESNKATTQKDFFENIPLEKVEFLIKSKNKNRWTKRIFKIKNGKKEYKYTREYDNNFIESKEVGETFFNTVIPIKACEMEQIHSSEYIIDILKPVILEYTRSYGD